MISDKRTVPMAAGDRAPDFDLPAAHQDDGFPGRLPGPEPGPGGSPPGTLLSLLPTACRPPGEDGVLPGEDGCADGGGAGHRAPAGPAVLPLPSPGHAGGRRLRAPDPSGLRPAQPGPPTPEAYGVAESAAARELGLTGPVEGALERLGRHDGYALTPDDTADFGRHQVQLTGQFLIDRAGVVRRATSSAPATEWPGSGNFLRRPRSWRRPAPCEPDSGGGLVTRPAGAPPRRGVPAVRASGWSASPGSRDGAGCEPA